MKYSKIIEAAYKTVMETENVGTVPTYIPELAQVDPNKFGVYFYSLNKQSYGIGDCDEKFSCQSISKVLALCLAYSIIGDKLWKRVDVEPSGTSFNSLVQLEADNGIPRNPLINAGAIVVCDILLSILEDAEADFLTFVRDLANDESVNYSIRVAESEKSVGYRNFALCYYIKSLGNIENDPIEVLNFYFKLCSLELSCKSLAYIFSFLANDGIRMHDRVQILTDTWSKRVNASMQTCGFYDESGEFAFKVGLPGKSGVGGGIVALLPNHYSIAVWSPKLNSKGNSYRGMLFLEEFTAQTHTSIF